MTTTKRVEAADLRVGQVWVPKRGTKKRHILSLDPLRYTQGGREQRCVGLEQLVAFLNDDECTLSFEAPSPIPHPSALGDLYAACKAVLDAYNVAHPNWSVVANQCAAAIRKAGGEA